MDCKWEHNMDIENLGHGPQCRVVKIDEEDGRVFVRYADGSSESWENGVLHADGAAAVEHEGDREEYWVHGQLHRTDGPAIEDYMLGPQEYWIDGKRHREDGPAVEYYDGSGEWWLDDIEYTFEEYVKQLLLAGANSLDVIILLSNYRVNIAA
jgi:hypothetical protein